MTDPVQRFVRHHVASSAGAPRPGLPDPFVATTWLIDEIVILADQIATLSVSLRAARTSRDLPLLIRSSAELAVAGEQMKQLSVGLANATAKHRTAGGGIDAH